MKIHEYQAKGLFRAYGIPVPRGIVAESVDQAVELGGRFNVFPVAVKAQIHAGGRGKGGGIRLVNDIRELAEAARAILGMNLVTRQTGPAGRRVEKLLLEEAFVPEGEFYLGILPERGTASIVIMASPAGGMDIEEVAEKNPEKIIRVSVNPLQGIRPHHIREIVFGLGVARETRNQWLELISSLYRLFVENDCSLIEINPVGITENGSPLALDAKIDLDGNALFRHPELRELHDANEEDPLEAEARESGLNYIKLSGNVGNMVNGAGLAMATMDMIKRAGAEPANFLDVGGGANARMIAKGLQIILKDSDVRAVFVNIFGGILRCDVLAQGIVEAARKVDLDLPVVIRMEGTNVEEGQAILAGSGLALITAENLADAAAKISEVLA